MNSDMIPILAVLITAISTLVAVFITNYFNMKSLDKNLKISSGFILTSLNTLKEYLPYISNSLTYEYSNGGLEGINNKIKVLKRTNIMDKFVSIEWDGKDDDGDYIANGTYIYKLIVKTDDGSYSKVHTGKLAKLK